MKQIQESEMKYGFFKVTFFSEKSILADSKTNEISEFYLYPNGGTLRDKNFNIVSYLPRFDTSRGFVPPNENKEREAI